MIWLFALAIAAITIHALAAVYVENHIGRNITE